MIEDLAMNKNNWKIAMINSDVPPTTDEIRRMAQNQTEWRHIVDDLCSDVLNVMVFVADAENDSIAFGINSFLYITDWVQ